ncbi:hypothetical protein RND71_004779 [Anisodus tanguticus]|uniref:Uncharacterized protein n=1 Tax=Anisodus tanguticus TaxID=243964 RepID=A0AAE1SRK3_9SOLA|nr:hypothetical protein RND71_004779 [Anisodus tanguticus]
MPCLRVLDLQLPNSSFFRPYCSVSRNFKCSRNCHSIYEMPGHIGALKSMEVLDFSGTELHNLHPEIGKLTHRKHLHLSFYGADDEREASYLPDGLFSTDIIAKLPDLQALSIGVHPKDKRWSRDVGQILKDINRLQNLRHLQFYFPTVALLEMFIDMSHSWKNNLLTRFKIIVGQNVKHVVDRVSRSEEHKYDKHDRCLRFVNGEEISNSVMNVLVENEGRSEPVMPALEHLGIHYLWRLENICRKYSLPSGSFVEDCKTLKEIIEEREVIVEDHGSALCSLKELKLRHLTELVRLWNSSIPYVEKHDIDGCPKLKDGKFEELSYQM